MPAKQKPFSSHFIQMDKNQFLDANKMINFILFIFIDPFFFYFLYSHLEKLDWIKYIFVTVLSVFMEINRFSRRNKRICISHTSIASKVTAICVPFVCVCRQSAKGPFIMNTIHISLLPLFSLIWIHSFHPSHSLSQRKSVTLMPNSNEYWLHRTAYNVFAREWRT